MSLCTFRGEKHQWRSPKKRSLYLVFFTRYLLWLCSYLVFVVAPLSPIGSERLHFFAFTTYSLLASSNSVMYFQTVPAESPLPKHLDTSRNEAFLKVFSNVFADSVGQSSWTTAALTSEFRIVAEATEREQSQSNSHGGKVDAAVFPCRNAAAALQQHSLLTGTIHGKSPSLSHLSCEWAVLSSSSSCTSSNAAKHQPTLNRQFNAARLPSIAVLVRTKRDGKVFALVVTPYDPQKTVPPTASTAPAQVTPHPNISLNISAIPQHHNDPVDVSGLLDRDPVFRNGVRTFDVFPYGPVQKNAAMINAIDNSNASSVLDAKQRPVGICYTLAICPVAADSRHVIISVDGRFVTVFREYDLGDLEFSSSSAGQASEMHLPLVLDTDKGLEYVNVVMSRLRSPNPQQAHRKQLLWVGASMLSDRVALTNGVQRSDALTFATIHSDRSVRVFTMMDGARSDSDNTRMFSPTESSFAGGDGTCRLHCVAVTRLNDRVTSASGSGLGAFNNVVGGSHFLSVEVSASTAADESRTFNRSHAASLQFASAHGSQKRSVAQSNRGTSSPQALAAPTDWSPTEGELVAAVSPNGSLLMCLHSASQKAFFIPLGHQQPVVEISLAGVVGGERDNRTTPVRCLSVMWSPLGAAGGVYASVVSGVSESSLIWIGLNGECCVIQARDFLGGCQTPFAQNPHIRRCSHVGGQDAKLPLVLLCHAACKHDTVSLSLAVVANSGVAANFTSILSVCCTPRLLSPQSVASYASSTAQPNHRPSRAVVDGRVLSCLFFGCRAITAESPKPCSSFAAVLSKVLGSLHRNRHLLLSGAVAFADALAVCINGVMVPPAVAHGGDDVTSEFHDIVMWAPNILSTGIRQSACEGHHIAHRVFSTTMGEEYLIVIEHLLKPLIAYGAVSQVTEIVDRLNSTLLGGSRESLILADYAALCCASSSSLGGFCFPVQAAAKSLPMFHKIQQQCTPEMQLMLSWPTFQSQRIEELTQVSKESVTTTTAPITGTAAPVPSQPEEPRAVTTLEELFAAAIASLSSAPPVSNTAAPTKSYVALPLTFVEVEALIPFLLTRYGANRVYECTVALLGRRDDIVGCSPEVLERLNSLCHQLRGILS